MTSRSRTFGVVASLAVVAVLAGCGGSSGTSKADFANKADAVCAATNKAHPPKPAPKNPKEAAAQQAEEISIRNELDRKLKALSAPSDAKSDSEAYNAGTQTILAAINKMKADAAKGDQKQYATDSAQFAKAAADREKVAVKLGFKTCGRSNPAQ
jgi:hypothetical protein